jgi:hypothetical protein
VLWTWARLVMVMASEAIVFATVGMERCCSSTLDLGEIGDVEYGETMASEAYGFADSGCGKR